MIKGAKAQYAGDEVVLVLSRDENDLLLCALYERKRTVSSPEKGSIAHVQLLDDLNNMIHYLETGERLEEPDGNR